jgi:ketosteroid isomerase-like protein
MNATDTISAAEQAVRAALARFNAAAKAGDAAALEALLATDLMYSHSNAKVENKAECIAGLVRSNIDFQLRDGLTVLAYNGGTCAMVHGMMDAHNPGGVIVPLHFRMMWVKSGDDWLLVGRHTAKLPG